MFNFFKKKEYVTKDEFFKYQVDTLQVINDLTIKVERQKIALEESDITSTDLFSHNEPTKDEIVKEKLAKVRDGKSSTYFILGHDEYTCINDVRKALKSRCGESVVSNIRIVGVDFGTNTIYHKGTYSISPIDHRRTRGAFKLAFGGNWTLVEVK